MPRKRNEGPNRRWKRILIRRIGRFRYVSCLERWSVFSLKGEASGSSEIGTGSGMGVAKAREERDVNVNVIRIHPDDSVAVALQEMRIGEPLIGAGLGNVTVREDIMRNHKIALRDIPEDAPVIKYGETIGRASRPIRTGEWVHTHNLK
jgi:hypothetical protein